MSIELDQLNNAVLQAIASGLNDAATVLYNDIEAHVRIKTGYLHDSYAITQLATPDHLDTKIDSPANYKQWQYPQIPQRTKDGDGLFLDPTKVEQVVNQAIENRINQI